MSGFVDTHKCDRYNPEGYAGAHENEEAPQSAMGGTVLRSERRAYLQGRDHAPQPRREDVHKSSRCGSRQDKYTERTCWDWGVFTKMHGAWR